MKVPTVFAVLAISPALAVTPIAADRAAGYEGSYITVQGLAAVKLATAEHDGGVEVALRGENGASGLVAYIPQAIGMAFWT